jgi:hypothetical protein
LSRTKVVNWRAVSAVIMPEAAISCRQADEAQVSGVPSAYNAKRMGDEPSEFPPTGSSEPDVNAAPNKGESTSARQIDARMRGTEQDNLYSIPSRIMMPFRSGAMRRWLAMRKHPLESPPVDIVSSPFIR